MEAIQIKCSEEVFQALVWVILLKATHSAETPWFTSLTSSADHLVFSLLQALRGILVNTYHKHDIYLLGHTGIFHVKSNVQHCIHIPLMLVSCTQKTALPHVQKAGYPWQKSLFVESVVAQASRDSEITCSTIHLHQLEANEGFRSVLKSSWTCAFACTCTYAPVCFFSLDSLSWTCFTVGNADRCSFTASVIGKPMSSRAIAGVPLMEPCCIVLLWELSASKDLHFSLTSLCAHPYLYS